MIEEIIDAQAQDEIHLTADYGGGRKIIKVDRGYSGSATIFADFDNKYDGEPIPNPGEITVFLVQGDNRDQFAKIEYEPARLEFDNRGPIQVELRVEDDSSQIINADANERRIWYEGEAQVAFGRNDAAVFPVEIVKDYDSVEDVSITNLSAKTSENSLTASYEVTNPVTHGVPVTIAESLTREDTGDVLYQNERSQTITGVINRGDTNREEITTQINTNNGPDIPVQFCASLSAIDGQKLGNNETTARDELASNGVNPADGISSAELARAEQLFNQGKISLEALQLAVKLHEQ